jgi:predicted methyltransferase|nr:class I SAM-dependent methyltransferase [Shouchella clausii]
MPRLLGGGAVNLLGVLPFAHSLLTSAVQPGDTVVDATIGNGHDTLVLAKLVGETGVVIGCDIQASALTSTEARLQKAGLDKQVSLFQIGHEKLATLPLFVNSTIAAAIFNLGYLPGGDKGVTTTGKTTIAAIEQLFNRLKQGGLIVLVVYHGHPQGKKEKNELLAYVESLPQEKAHAATYQFINQKNDPPFVVAIEKRAKFHL